MKQIHVRNVSGRTRTAAALLALALVLSCCPAGAEKPGWTVLVYMVGSDLESGDGLFMPGGNATEDLAEMQASVREDTELIVMTGGAESWRSRDIPADRCCVWRVTGKGRELLGEMPGGMGSPDTLSRLLAWLPEDPDTPAALIFWNHGFGPMEGFGSDLTSADARLTLPEIVSALDGAGVRERPLSLIGFDACMMASAETVLAFAPFARYMVASEDLEPAEGWDYGFLKTLGADTDGEAAGRAVVSGYARFIDEVYGREPAYMEQENYALTLVDLTRAQGLGPALNGFFSALDSRLQTGQFTAVSGVRTKSRGAMRSTDTEYDLVDLFCLASEYGEALADAGPVLDSLRACVLAPRSDEKEGEKGLAVYFPQNAEPAHQRFWREALGRLSPGEKWLSFMDHYEAALRAGSRTPFTTPVQGEEPCSVVLTDDQLGELAWAYYLILEETPGEGFRLVYSGDNCTIAGNTVRAGYAGTTLQIRSGEHTAPLIPILRQAGGQGALCRTVGLLYRKHDDDLPPWPEGNVTLLISHDPDTGRWNLLSVRPSDDSRLDTGRERIELTDYDKISFGSGANVPTRDNRGSLIPFTQWEKAGKIAGYECPLGDRVELEEVPLPRADGCRYWLQIILVDVYNAPYASELFELEE